MPNYLEGDLSGKDLKFGLVVSRFNDFITSRLEQGAVDALSRHGVQSADIDVVRVPGAFEIPAAARRLANGKKKYDALICLGAVIRGATPHFNYVSGESAKGVGALAMEAGVPVIYGILTTDTVEQAVERAGTKGGNKGWEAGLAAIEMANLYKKI